MKKIIEMSGKKFPDFLIDLQVVGMCIAAICFE
jgi:hypothetical protein